MPRDYDPDDDSWAQLELPWSVKDREEKGGKPSPGTDKDKRLKENKPDNSKPSDDGDKKPFPNAAPPFKKPSDKKPKKS